MGRTSTWKGRAVDSGREFSFQGWFLLAEVLQHANSQNRASYEELIVKGFNQAYQRITKAWYFLHIASFIMRTISYQGGLACVSI